MKIIKVCLSKQCISNHIPFFQNPTYQRGGSFINLLVRSFTNFGKIENELRPAQKHLKENSHLELKWKRRRLYLKARGGLDATVEVASPRSSLFMSTLGHYCYLFLLIYELKAILGGYKIFVAMSLGGSPKVTMPYIRT